LSRNPVVNSIYYIFTVDAGQYFDDIIPNQPENKGLCYTVIDAELNDGLGEIVEINTLIYKPAAEKLTATIHYNNQDLWIVSHEWNSDKFISVLLTDQGIEDVINSTGGLNYTGSSLRSIGMMKFSPCGTKLAAAVNEYDFIELFSFDNSTGKVFNPISIRTFGRNSNYGVEFSPNGNKLYVSDFTQRSINQYDVTDLDSDLINLSGRKIYGNSNRAMPGALQIGPNGKIYIAMLNSSYLDVIENPNLTGDECNYHADAIRLSSQKFSAKSLYGLPNMSQGYFFMKSNLQDTIVCGGDNLIIDPVTNVLFNEMTFIWEGPNGYSSTEYFLKIDNFSENDVGKYYFQAFFREYMISDSILISYSQIPIAKIIGDSIICSDAPIILSSQFEAHEYIWSTGDSTQSIEVNKPGKYVFNFVK
jgi:WD40 repeat protein